VGQALAWGVVAMAWPLAWSGWRIGRAAALAVWFALALAAQLVIPPCSAVWPSPRCAASPPSRPLLSSLA